MGVKLRENIKKSGVKSLFLDISVGGKRYKEYLGLHLIPAKTKEERERNKNIKILAESKRAKRELELIEQEQDYVLPQRRNIDFVKYFSDFVDDYPHKDKRIVRYAYEWFVKFLEIKKIDSILTRELTPELCKEYVEYMQKGLNGETPYNYYTKFKRVVRKAQKEKFMFDNPTDDIKVVRDEGLKKDILTFTEIQSLANTYCGNPDIKRAFLFCLNTGLRWVDVNELKFKNIDFSSSRLKFTQEKTKHSSKNSTVIIDLNLTAQKLIGEEGEPDKKIFNLPSHAGSLKTLKAWVKRAGINKHITWHCARHSFAVNLLGEVKADIKTVASLLGHSGLKHTEKYTRAVDELKNKAVNGLPEINI